MVPLEVISRSSSCPTAPVILTASNDLTNAERKTEEVDLTITDPKRKQAKAARQVDERSLPGEEAHKHRRLEPVRAPFHVEVDLDALAQSFGAGLCVSRDETDGHRLPVSSQLRRDDKGKILPSSSSSGTTVTESATDRKIDTGPPLWSTPLGLAIAQPYRLMEHQLSAVQTLLRAEEDERQNEPPGWLGSALLHQRGMGKTLTSIAWALASQKRDKASQDTNRKGGGNGITLLVCPVSLLSVWVEEIEKFFPQRVRLLVLRADTLGAARWASLTSSDLDGLDFVITNYETVLGGAKQLGVMSTLSAAGGSRSAGLCLTADETIASSSVSSSSSSGSRNIVSAGGGGGGGGGAAALLCTERWQRLIVDEATKLLRSDTQTARSLQFVTCVGPRLAVTGEPVPSRSASERTLLAWLGWQSTWPDTPEERTRRHAEQHLLRAQWTDHGCPLPALTEHVQTITLDPTSRALADWCIDLLRTLPPGTERKAGLAMLRQIAWAPNLLVTSHEARQTTTTTTTTTVTEDGPPTVASCFSHWCPEERLVATVERWRREQGEAVTRQWPTVEPLLASWQAWLSVRAGPAGVQSPKLSAMVELVARLLRGGQHEKLVVMAHSENQLGLVMAALRGLGRPDSPPWVLMVHGNLKPETRQARLLQFRSQSTVQVLLLTYGVGAQGLTLTEASAVLLLERGWQPELEQSAIQRVHRLGQTRPVEVWSIALPEEAEWQAWLASSSSSSSSSSSKGRLLDTLTAPSFASAPPPPPPLSKQPSTMLSPSSSSSSQPFAPPRKPPPKQKKQPKKKETGVFALSLS